MSIKDVYNALLNVNAITQFNSSELSFNCGDDCIYNEDCDNCPTQVRVNELDIERWISDIKLSDFE